MTPDVLVVGGGAIGLSLADCLLRQGGSVAIVDKGALGQEASWAGAGMLTCRPRWRAGTQPKTDGQEEMCTGCEQPHPIEMDCGTAAKKAGTQKAESGKAEQKKDPPLPPLMKGGRTEPDISDLKLLSVRLHAVWAERLKAETGIDTGYRVCGALEVLLPGEDSEEERERLKDLAASCNERGVTARWLSGKELRALEPGLHPEISGGIEIPNEGQIRNPWLLRALIASVKAKGAQIYEGREVADIAVDNGRACGVVLSDGSRIAAGNVAICAGAWTGKLSTLAKLAPASGKIEPIRGQLLAYQADPKLATRLLTGGNHYLVPRGDGIILAGATHDKAGFDKSTTAEGREELENFVKKVLPALSTCAIVKTWAGLRPGLKGRHPLIGPVGKMEGLYLASGHYRNGLVLAPATAELLSSIILKKTPLLAPEGWFPR